jgi:UDP-4-amino-4,6-dideoxy-N-acetyl-beta-L-altrosamine transaminase
MKIIPYARQCIDSDDLKAVVKVLKSDFLTQGPIIPEFEKAVADYCGAKYAVAVNSGTSALHLACVAVGISKGDEVITTPITFVASANCVLYCGGDVVFADIDDKTASIDPSQIARKITRRTKAVIPVDFAGTPADLKSIHAIAKKNKLIVIEDACHAFGAKYEGKMIGSNSCADMTVFSFHAVKHIATGEGGMILTNREDFYKRMMLLRTHGITRDPKDMQQNDGGWYYQMQELGFNYRMTEFQAALGLSQLKKIDKFLRIRREIAESYDKAFITFDEVRVLSSRANAQSSHHLYVLRFHAENFSVTRGEIFDEYRRNGILVNVHYIPVYQHPYYRKLGFSAKGFPNAERYYAQAVTLPLYPGMSKADTARVIKVTQSIISRFRKK